MKRYAIVIENTGKNYSAYAPDIEGCGAAGETLEETIQNMREALEFHIEGLLANNEPVPEPSVEVAYVEINVPVNAR